MNTPNKSILGLLLLVSSPMLSAEQCFMWQLNGNLYSDPDAACSAFHSSKSSTTSDSTRQNLIPLYEDRYKCTIEVYSDRLNVWGQMWSSNIIRTEIDCNSDDCEESAPDSASFYGYSDPSIELDQLCRQNCLFTLNTGFKPFIDGVGYGSQYVNTRTNCPEPSDDFTPPPFIHDGMEENPNENNCIERQSDGYRVCYPDPDTDMNCGTVNGNRVCADGSNLPTGDCTLFDNGDYICTHNPDNPIPPDKQPDEPPQTTIAGENDQTTEAYNNPPHGNEPGDDPTNEEPSNEGDGLTLDQLRNFAHEGQTEMANKIHEEKTNAENTIATKGDSFLDAFEREANKTGTDYDGWNDGTGDGQLGGIADSIKGLIKPPSGCQNPSAEFSQGTLDVDICSAADRLEPYLNFLLIASTIIFVFYRLTDLLREFG